MLVPWQPALFKARNDPGSSVGAEVNLGGVAAEFNGNVSCRVPKACIEQSCKIVGKISNSITKGKYSLDIVLESYS